MTIYITKDFDPYFLSIINNASVEIVRTMLCAFLNDIGADLEDILKVENHLDGTLSDHCAVRIYNGLRLIDTYYFDFDFE